MIQFSPCIFKKEWKTFKNIFLKVKTSYDTYIAMFTAAQFISAESWEQTVWSSADEWIMEMCYCVLSSTSAIKRVKQAICRKMCTLGLYCCQLSQIPAYIPHSFETQYVKYIIKDRHRKSYCNTACPIVSKCMWQYNCFLCFIIFLVC